MNDEIINKYIDVIILNFLNEKDLTAYQISNNIIDNSLNIKDVFLYLNFKKLIKLNYIESYWDNKENNVNKKYYKITNEGRKFLKVRLEEWKNTKRRLEILLGDK